MNASWLMVAGAALIGAQVASVVIEHRMSAAEIRLARAPPVREREADSSIYAAFLERNIFRARVKEAVSSEASECQRSNVRLVATLISEREEDCAITVAGPEVPVSVRRMGEQVGELVVVMIEPGRAMIARKGRCEVLELAELPRAERGAEREAAAGARRGIRRLGPYEVEVERSLVEQTLGDLAALNRDGRIVPRFERGQATGFELKMVRPGGVFDAIGLTTGDVVQKINGHDLTDPKRSLELYAGRKETETYEVELLRRGAPLTLTYRLR